MLLVMATGMATNAWADPGSVRTAWSTYLRVGPGESYAAVSEVEHDTAVAVQACGPRWCRVFDGAVEGYVDRDALALTRTRPPARPATTGCVVADQADSRRPMPTRFCSAPPTGR